jgi:outer membrane murein-binding lipoprotein Lpp
VAVPEPSPPIHSGPFPGLRSFRTSEARFFFGRDSHTEALLQRLAGARFLAVVGASGGGKSSLVRAGLLPALYRGYLTGSTTRWRIAVMRPGGAPIDALAQALATDARLAPKQECLRLLEGTTLGLVDLAEGGQLAPGESLLVVVDQFEELFRYEGSDAEERLRFVSLLLNAVDRSTPPIYVVLTMRYEYLADCAAFPGLPEALNTSQYLIPRLNREQRREAVEGPLRLVGMGIAPSLVQAVLNEAGDDPYQLPVLQHALHRTYECWVAAGRKGEITLAHYDQAGRIARALDVHANDIHGGLDPAVKGLVEPIFRCLTVTDDEGRLTRRPRSLDHLCRVMGADGDPARAKGIAAVVRAFAAPEHSLLLLAPDELTGDTEIDISHESLIRGWKKLTSAARSEARSAARYRDLAKATLRHATGESGLWRDPELKQVLHLRASERWNSSWAEQYWKPPQPPSFEVTSDFLSKSRRAQLLTRVALFAAILAGLGLAGYLYKQRLDLADAAVRYARLQAQSDLAAQEVENLKKQIELARNSNASATTIADLERQLLTARAGQAQAQQAAAGVAKPADDPTAIRGRIPQLEGQLARATKELMAARQEIADLTKQLAAAQQRVTQLEQRPATGQYPDAELTRRATTAEARVRELEGALKGATPSRAPPGEPSGVRKGLEWYQSYEEGQKALAEGRFPEAVFYLRLALGKAPKEARNVKYLTREIPYYVPHYYLSLAYMGYGAFDEACSSARAAVASGIAQQKEDLRAPLAAVRAYCDQRSSAKGD